jgi:hypothetical protein
MQTIESWIAMWGFEHILQAFWASFAFGLAKLARDGRFL